MPNRSYGVVPQGRARRLLEDLLNYANYDPKVKLIEKLTVNWAKNKPKLAVRCTIKSLIELTKADRYQEVIDKPKIEDAIDFFETYLEILINFSQTTAGDREFIFDLWDTDKNKNLKYFDEVCKVKDSEKLPNRRATSNSDPQAEEEIQSNEEDLRKNLTSNAPSFEALRNKLTDLTDKYTKLDDAFQTEKQANQNLTKQIKIANLNVSRALRLLLILALPIQILSGAMYNNIYQKNNSSVSSPSNTKNYDSNTSTNDLPHFSRQTNTASPTAEKEKNNYESKVEEKSQCP